MTREQMAAFMARLYQAITGKAVPLTKNIFHDTSDSFAADDIRRILGLGVTQGTGRGTFSPPQNVVTREQMAAFLARLYKTIQTERRVA